MFTFSLVFSAGLTNLWNYFITRGATETGGIIGLKRLLWLEKDDLLGVKSSLTKSSHIWIILEHLHSFKQFSDRDPVFQYKKSNFPQSTFASR